MGHSRKRVVATQNTRRNFLKCTTAIAVSSIFPQVIHANSSSFSERTLEFINLHTDESVRCCYWENGEYNHESLAEINHTLRDHRANEVAEMDVSLLDLLHLIHKTSGSQAPFHVISGYRSALTNEKLRKQGNGVAKRSLHMQGKAIDIRLPDVELQQLRDVALSLKAGGVGYYAKSNFIHVDIGRPRSW